MKRRLPPPPCRRKVAISQRAAGLPAPHAPAGKSQGHWLRPGGSNWLPLYDCVVKTYCGFVSLLKKTETESWGEGWLISVFPKSFKVVIKRAQLKLKLGEKKFHHRWNLFQSIRSSFCYWLLWGAVRKSFVPAAVRHLNKLCFHS